MDFFVQKRKWRWRIQNPTNEYGTPPLLIDLPPSQKMKLKHLEAALSSITREFPSPKVQLEQYPTSAHLTASIILLALEKGDLGSDLTCLDLGCGTGMLSIGAAFVCSAVLAIDCDWDAIQVAQENASQVELDDTIQFLQAQVWTKESSSVGGGSKKKKNPPSRGGGAGRKGRGRGGRGGGRGSQPSHQTKSILILDGKDGIPLQDNCVDTVLTNPPFGTKHNAGIDVQFLLTATRLARRAVYSFHKRSTRAYLLKTIQEWGFQAEVAAEMEFDISQMYQFHKEKTKDVEVDLLRVLIHKDKDDYGEEDDDENSPLQEKNDYQSPSSVLLSLSTKQSHE